MIKNYLLNLLFILILGVPTAFGAAPARTDQNQSSHSSKSSKKVVSEAGLNIPDWGIAVDAVYDNRLDRLVPGYKILNVVLSDRSPSTIMLDPRKDRWFITDNIGTRHNAINHLRLADEKAWLALPQGLRDKLEYPNSVRTGNSTKIDLFFPANIDLANFREIGWHSSHFKREFNMTSSLDKNQNRDEPIPPPTPSAEQSFQKYDGPIKKDPDSIPSSDRISEPPPRDMREPVTLPAL